MRNFELDGETYSIAAPTLCAIQFCSLVGQKYLRDRNTILSDTAQRERYCKILLPNASDVVTRVKSVADYKTGFRPCLRLVRKEQKGCSDVNGVDDREFDYIYIKNGTFCRMFTMLLDGRPIPAPGVFRGEPLSWSFLKGNHRGEIAFSDEYYGDAYLLPWIFANGMAFCTTVVMVDISWDELNRQGYC